MATIPSSNPLHLLTTPFRRPKHASSFSVKSSSGNDTSPPDTSSSASSTPIPADDGAFENRTASATGAVPERRQSFAKQRKQAEEGFSPYSEKINGRIAILGMTALLLAELATGKGVINYHTPAIILIQVYFVPAVGAVSIKDEKESVGVWPKP